MPVTGENGFLEPRYKSDLVARRRVHDGNKYLCCHAIETCHDQHAVGITVGPEHDFQVACLPAKRCFRDLCNAAGRDPKYVARWMPLVLVA